MITIKSLAIKNDELCGTSLPTITAPVWATLQPILLCNIENYFNIEYAFTVRIDTKLIQMHLQLKIILQLVKNQDNELLTLKVLNETLFCFTFDATSVCPVYFLLLSCYAFCLSEVLLSFVAFITRIMLIKTTKVTLDKRTKNHVINKKNLRWQSFFLSPCFPCNVVLSGPLK